MKTIRSRFVKLELHTEDFFDYFDKKEAARREEACKLVVRRMRKNLRNVHPSSQGGFPAMYSKSLLKGVGYEVRAFSKATGTMESEVGNYSPHAHLVEFGHGDGTLRSKTKRPHMEKTFKEVEEKLIEIMSQEYL